MVAVSRARNKSRHALHVYLMPQDQNLCLERYPRPEQIDDRPTNKFTKTLHPTAGLPDSRSTASRTRFATGTRPSLPEQSRKSLRKHWEIAPNYKRIPQQDISVQSNPAKANTSLNITFWLQSGAHAPRVREGYAQWKGHRDRSAPEINRFLLFLGHAASFIVGWARGVAKNLATAVLFPARGKHSLHSRHHFASCSRIDCNSWRRFALVLG
jgi:hypothetical protein